MIKAVLIDDEAQSSKSLTIKLAAALQDVSVLAVFENPEHALRSLAELNPDVIFLDIEMPGLNGFQLLERIGDSNLEIIFVTAYNEYVVQALRMSAFDYLLKPVDKNELEASLARLAQKLSTKPDNETAGRMKLFSEHLHQPRQAPKRIALSTAQGVQFIKTAEIIRVEASSNYTTFHLTSRPKITVSKTLKEFEQVLTAQHFFRINRSCIVNLEFITELRKAEGGTVLLEDGTEVDIAPFRKQELMQKLQGL
jgi:two-component system LytT family response regulator